MNKWIYDKKFNSLQHKENRWYIIYLDGLPDKQEQHNWIEHLRCKNWVTDKTLNDFKDKLKELGLWAI